MIESIFLEGARNNNVWKMVGSPLHPVAKQHPLLMLRSRAHNASLRKGFEGFHFFTQFPDFVHGHKQDGAILLVGVEQACSTCEEPAVFVLLRETERLWENWLITKTAFPSP